MNPFFLIAVGIFLFLINFLYSSYSLKVLKEHSHKLTEYKKLKDDNLKLRAQIESILNAKELERYALRHGFKPFSWEETVLFLLTEPSRKGQSKKPRK